MIFLPKKEFGERLARLRIEKGVSAREMSLAIGQHHGFICNIENGNNYPSMQAFFYICEYLGVTPVEFFDLDTAAPTKLGHLMEKMKHLKGEQLKLLESVIDNMK